MVSADNFILPATVRISQSDPSDMFSGGCVFIDDAIGYAIIKHQVSINATKTVK